jgi:hypothetical protein
MIPKQRQTAVCCVQKTKGFPADKGFFLLFMIGLLMIVLSLQVKAEYDLYTIINTTTIQPMSSVSSVAMDDNYIYLATRSGSSSGYTWLVGTYLLNGTRLGTMNMSYYDSNITQYQHARLKYYDNNFYISTGNPAPTTLHKYDEFFNFENQKNMTGTNNYFGIVKYDDYYMFNNLSAGNRLSNFSISDLGVFTSNGQFAITATDIWGDDYFLYVLANTTGLRDMTIYDWNTRLVGNVDLLDKINNSVFNNTINNTMTFGGNTIHGNRQYISITDYSRSLIYVFYNDNTPIIPDYTIIGGIAFGLYQCLNDEEYLCSNTTLQSQGFNSSSGIGAYGLYATCHTEAAAKCVNECITYLESVAPGSELALEGFTDYVSGYCATANLTPPAGLDTCVIRGDYQCTGGRSYDICQDSDGDGWLTYEHDTCLPYMICNDGSDSTPCAFGNYTAWSWIDYTFIYTPSEDELLTAAKTNVEGNALKWDSYLNGDLRKAAQILSYPYFGILGFITQEAGTLLIANTVNTVEDLANSRGAYIGSYADNTNAQTYTSLNCDYTENITFDERTQARHLYSNIPLIINKTAWQNSELYNFDVSLDNVTDDFSSLNITLSNELNNQLDLLLEIDRAGKIITLTDMKTSNIILTEVYAAFDDFTNIHLLINHDKDFNSYTTQILGSFTPDSNIEWINSRSYSAPINASSGNPTMLIFTGGVADSIIIPNLLITRRSPYAGYKQSDEEPFSYNCQYTTNGCYLSRLFSSGSNQPAYHRYKDVRVCTSGLVSNDNPSDTINNANICADVLPGINTCGWSSAFKIVVIIYALIGVLIIGAVLGLMAGYFAPAVAISLIIDTMIILFAGLTGFIPAWFFIVILLIASAIASVIIRNSLIGGGGGQNGG